MSKKAERLKSAGFGTVVEVPWPLYWQGILHEIVALEPHLVYYVLRKGERDESASYVRFPHQDLETGAYYLSPVDRATWVAPAQVERAVRFYRGRIHQGHIDQARAFAEDEDHARFMIAYAEYLEVIHERFLRHRLWYYPFADFALTKVGGYQEALLRVLAGGLLARSQARYEAEFSPR